MCKAHSTYANDTFNKKKNCFLKFRFKMTSFLCQLPTPSYLPRGLHNSILAFPPFWEVKTDHISKTKDFQEVLEAVMVRNV